MTYSLRHGMFTSQRFLCHAVDSASFAFSNHNGGGGGDDYNNNDVDIDYANNNNYYYYYKNNINKGLEYTSKQYQSQCYNQYLQESTENTSFQSYL